MNKKGLKKDCGIRYHTLTTKVQFIYLVLLFTYAAPLLKVIPAVNISIACITFYTRKYLTERRLEKKIVFLGYLLYYIFQWIYDGLLFYHTIQYTLDVLLIYFFLRLNLFKYKRSLWMYLTINSTISIYLYLLYLGVFSQQIVSYFSGGFLIFCSSCITAKVTVICLNKCEKWLKQKYTI